MQQYRVVDSDGHIAEWKEDWAARFPEEWRSRAPQIVRDHRGGPRFIWEGHELPSSIYEGQGRWATAQIKRDANPDGMMNPHARIPDMDKEGIDRAILFGTVFVFHANSTTDWRLAKVATRAYNEWAHDYAAPYPERLFFTAILPLANADAAVAEAYHAVKNLGAVALVLPMNYRGMSLDNPHFWPVYEAAADLGVPICVHPSTGSLDYVRTVGGHDNWMITHALSFPMGLTHALASIVCSGIMKRFPTTRFAFLEGGCGWLPFYMDRFDEHVEKLPALAPNLDALPSEYIKSDQFAISCEPEEDLRHVIDAIGADRILYASDYAHWDAEFPHSVHAIADREELSDQEKLLILQDNSERFYQLRTGVAAR